MIEEWLIETDETDEVKGRVRRAVAHEKNNLHLHREVMTLLFEDSSRKKFLLQKRSLKKEQLPGLWTLSATGHVEWKDISEIDKDGYLTAAKREVEEEIGVRVKKLVLEGKLVQHNNKNWAMMGVVMGVYEGEAELDLKEVSEVKVFTKETIMEVNDQLTPGARSCLLFLRILDEQ